MRDNKDSHGLYITAEGQSAVGSVFKVCGAAPISSSLIRSLSALYICFIFCCTVTGSELDSCGSLMKPRPRIRGCVLWQTSSPLKPFPRDLHILQDLGLFLWLPGAAEAQKMNQDWWICPGGSRGTASAVMLNMLYSIPDVESALHCRLPETLVWLIDLCCLLVCLSVCYLIWTLVSFLIVLASCFHLVLFWWCTCPFVFLVLV